MQKTVDIKIKENVYTVSFPKTGQWLDISNLKARIANGDYNAFVSNDPSMIYAKILTDMVATYNVMIPDLKKDMNIDGLLNLDLIDSKLLLDSYTNTWLPFFNGWMDIITKPTTETPKEASL